LQRCERFGRPMGFELSTSRTRSTHVTVWPSKRSFSNPSVEIKTYSNSFRKVLRACCVTEVESLSLSSVVGNNTDLSKRSKCTINLKLQSGAQPGFCYGGRGLKMESFCDVILMTSLGDVICRRHQNDVIIDILEVLLRHN